MSEQRTIDEAGRYLWVTDACGDMKLLTSTHGCHVFGRPQNEGWRYWIVEHPSRRWITQRFVVSKEEALAECEAAVTSGRGLPCDTACQDPMWCIQRKLCKRQNEEDQNGCLPDATLALPAMSVLRPDTSPGLEMQMSKPGATVTRHKYMRGWWVLSCPGKAALCRTWQVPIFWLWMKLRKSA